MRVYGCRARISPEKMANASRMALCASGFQRAWASCAALQLGRCAGRSRAFAARGAEHRVLHRDASVAQPRDQVSEGHLAGARGEQLERDGVAESGRRNRPA